MLIQLRPPMIISLIGGLLLSGAFAPAASATAVPIATSSHRIHWERCPDSDTAECGTLTLPVDWNHPGGRTFELALARHPATGDPTQRIGSLIFGPGGPGDSGVDRVVNGISRFSADLQRRFDIVSFDPRGVGGSNPVRCSSELLDQQPSPLLASQSAFEATLAFNRRLAADCRRHTGPVFDHLDTLSTVRDLDAIRQALGERTLTFHGSSYGTLLGEQYAETFPQRVRALVLESVVDHSLGTTAFLQTQAETEQDAFDEFVAWCERTETCALHGQPVRAVWSKLLARAGRGELADPDHAGSKLTPFTLTVLAQTAFYGPDWADLATTLADLSTGPADLSRAGSALPEPKAPSSNALDHRGDWQQEREASWPSRRSHRTPGTTSRYPFAVFCEDFELPVRDYSQYAAMLRRIAQTSPEMRYPRSLLAISGCLGAPAPVHNPQHRLSVHGSYPILLTNSLHDPASGYNWATNVARQLGDQAVLLTYQGSGHGTYNSTPCARSAIDLYLIARVLPSNLRCPAVEPAGRGGKIEPFAVV